MQLTVPYASCAEFRAWPTSLDTLNLVSGNPSLAAQDSALNKILLTASTWCDSVCDLGDDGTLAAHVRTESKRLRPDRSGRLVLHPDHIPFVSVISVAYGATLGGRTLHTNPPVFVEDNRTVVLDQQAGGSSWSGSLQFGGPSPGAALYTTWTYVAGYPNTVMTGDVSAGAVALPVADAIGIQPGAGLRIYDPGSDESVTVSPGWVPATGPASVPLAAGLLYAHAVVDPQTQQPAPARVSGMGVDVMEACILYATALLMRPDSSAEDAFPGLRDGVSTRAADARRSGSGLVCEAEKLLASYRRVI